MSLKSTAQELSMTILHDVDHGEVFNDYDLYKEFCEQLNHLKNVTDRLYEENENKEEQNNE